MTKKLQSPDCIIEASWEVCNKVGGIYTVLSTRAKTLQDKFCDKVFFIGPDFWIGKNNPLFIESTELYADWRMHALQSQDLKVRVGRWNIPGQPIVFLVDFTPFFDQKNEVYSEMWNDYAVDSLHAYGDYDESCMFAIAAAKVTESFCKYNVNPTDKVVFQAHEWMTAMSALYLQKHMPTIATVFTTHATSIGRSIAGNGKPLYEYLPQYNGDQMAAELNMQSKHSVEKQTAHFADCFTTVSQITDIECRELLDKPADVVLMNGFEDDFVPKGTAFTASRKAARKKLFMVANCMFGEKFGNDTLVVATSGRYEFKNKGIDEFIEAMARLNGNDQLDKKVLALITVPGWVYAPRLDLQERIAENTEFDTPLQQAGITHWLHQMEGDRVMDMLHRYGMNKPSDRVKVMFVPCYLDGADGILDMHYYDLLPGEDLTVYASYYEPWGYTPLESVAFKVPTITTDLAGFGLWAKTTGVEDSLLSGVKVVHRSDYNYTEVAEDIEKAVLAYAGMDAKSVQTSRRKAGALASKALWKHFIAYYYQAYDVALRKAALRNAE